MMTTDELYGSQSFDDLYDIGAIAVYEMHIEKLEQQLMLVTTDGDYHLGKQIQDAQELFRTLTRQVIERRTNGTVGK